MDGEIYNTQGILPCATVILKGECSITEIY